MDGEKTRAPEPNLSMKYDLLWCEIIYDMKWDMWWLNGWWNIDYERDDALWKILILW